MQLSARSVPNCAKYRWKMKAQPELTQVEKDKLEINPDFDFREIANIPFENITPNELAMFKWSGVYHQLQPDFFMIRIVTPGGRLTTKQFNRANAYLDFDEVTPVKSFPFGPNQAIVFVKTFNSWHAVWPMQGSDPALLRRTLTINIESS